MCYNVFRCNTAYNSSDSKLKKIVNGRLNELLLCWDCAIHIKYIIYIIYLVIASKLLVLQPERIHICQYIQKYLFCTDSPNRAIRYIQSQTRYPMEIKSMLLIIMN